MTTTGKRVATYTRVSTDQQTTTNQSAELEAAALRNGWTIVATFTDEGISGSKGRDRRPGFDALCKGIARRDFDVVAAWSVDRLGRSLKDLVTFLDELRAKNVDLYLHRQGLDTATPAGRALFGMLSIFAEFERSIIVERVKAGLQRARAKGVRLGQAPLPAATREKVITLRASGLTIPAVATQAGCSIRSVERVLKAHRAAPTT
jgi:DNA invertase Pin-like site-specific DNA recombinase